MTAIYGTILSSDEKGCCAFSLICFIPLFILLFLLPPSNTTARGPQKTILRTNDYIIIHGNQLKHTLNKKISSLSLFASMRGKAYPIPFQVDEIDPKGEWVLTNLPAGLDEDIKADKDSDNGRVDENDELVFMLKDTGGRLSKKNYPENAEAVDEIEITNPANGRKAWAYLCSFTKDPPLSNIDYVKHVSSENKIYNDSYVLKFPAERPVFPDYLSISGYDDILDRVKLRIKVRIFGIPYSLDETEFVSKLSLYNDGPVRTIRRTRNSIKIMGIFRTPSAAVEMISYRNICILPMRVLIPLNIKSFKSVFSVKLRAGADFYNVKGWRFRTDVHKEWVNIDGKMDRVEEAINGTDVSWFLLAGENRAFLIRAILNRNPDGSYQDTPFTPHLYYVDNDCADDPPEEIPGQSPNVNLWMDGFENLTKGTLYFYMIFYIMDNYKDGMESQYLQILDKPVKSSVNP